MQYPDKSIDGRPTDRTALSAPGQRAAGAIPDREVSSMSKSRPSRHLLARLLTLSAVALLPVAVNSTASADPVGQYVALGDSFASTGSLTQLGSGPLGCARATDNYPSVLARTVGAAQFIDVTCGSAVVANMTGSELTPAGINPAQLNALTPAADLVTITLGGNDFGFPDIAILCGTLGTFSPLGSPCRDHFTAGGDQIGARLANVAPRIGAVLDDIHRRAPHATVALVGYLPIVPAAGGCWPVMPIAQGDIPFLSDVTDRLNGMLADAAASHDTKFVDTAGALGHDACRPPGVRWVEGVIPGSPSLPVHPNAAGQAFMAQRVADVVGR